MKAFRVDFEYTEMASMHIAAKTAEEASAGALVMLKPRVKNPVVVNVSDAEPVIDAELGPAIEDEGTSGSTLN